MQHDIRNKLLAWYDAHRRELPWRARAGETPNPYHVWLSEIMLQQTTVPAVIPYFQKFLHLYPSIHDLAAAPQEDILREWAGLGYYARARNLHKCAMVISNDYKGLFPKSQKELKSLPGVGDYTSAAISAIAFNIPATVVDGNVERVISRLYGIKTPLPDAKREIKEKASLFFSDNEARAGDIAQAFMDLGSGVCTPKSPKCMLCPLSAHCETKSDALPTKKPKAPKPRREAYVYWIENEAGQVLLETRPEDLMLGGMVALPSSEWGIKIENNDHLEWVGGRKLNHFISHTFTHFHIDMHLYLGVVTGDIPDQYFWADKKRLPDIGFPSLFMKAYKGFLRF